MRTKEKPKTDHKQNVPGGAGGGWNKGKENSRAAFCIFPQGTASCTHVFRCFLVSDLRSSIANTVPPHGTL